MKSRSVRSMRLIPLAGLLVIGAAGTADAQCPTTQYPGQTNVGARENINATGRNIAYVCGGPLGAPAKVYITILSGGGQYGNNLMFLGSPTPASSPDSDVGPDKPFAVNPWAAPSPLQRVMLPGVYTVGNSLAFGLQVYSSQINDIYNVPNYTLQSAYKGSTASTVGNNGLGFLYAFGPGATVYQDNGTTPMPWSPYPQGMTYGFEDLRVGDLDYNDLVFVIETEVVPEPVTMALLATGLFGMGGAGVLRRRRKGPASA